MKRRPYDPPELTPLIDVVFLLLVFFLVSSVFKKDKLALLLNLPESKEIKTTIEKREIAIELSPAEVALNGKKCEFDDLDQELTAVVDKTTPVILRIDKNVHYQRIISLFDLLQKNRLTNIALVSERKRSDDTIND